MSPFFFSLVVGTLIGFKYFVVTGKTKCDMSELMKQWIRDRNEDIKTYREQTHFHSIFRPPTATPAAAAAAAAQKWELLGEI